jgi:hypothetical protein
MLNHPSFLNSGVLMFVGSLGKRNDFARCPRRQNPKKRNEPNFSRRKMTVSPFLNKTFAFSPFPFALKTNPIRTQCCAGFRPVQKPEAQAQGSQNPSQSPQNALYTPKNPEPNFSAKHPLLAHRISSPKTPIAPETAAKTPFTTPKNPKKTNPIPPRKDPMTEMQ